MRTVCWLLTLGILLSPSAKAEPMFAIANPKFSRLVLADYSVIDPAEDGKISKSILTQGRLYFSFKLLIGDKTLRYLQDNDQLEVAAVVYAGGIHRGTISLNIEQPKWEELRANITAAVESDGSFIYRTWMFIKMVNYSSVEVSIRDGAGNTIARESVQIIQ
jgi:hypothetical protein